MGAAKKRASRETPATRKKAKPTEGTPVVSFADGQAWSTWLSSHHGSSRGVWLKVAKKGSGRVSVTYAEALEVAIVWGWIDGQRKASDESWFLQKFAPRGPRSIWSKINRERALALIVAGKMRPPGLSEVERAKRDGRWEAAYEGQRSATVPPDLAAALSANRRAAAFFETLNSRNRYAVLFRTHTAKRPETRARRIAKFIEMLAKHEKLYP